MHTNIGGVDRIIRIIAGCALISISSCCEATPGGWACLVWSRL